MKRDFLVPVAVAAGALGATSSAGAIEAPSTDGIRAEQAITAEANAKLIIGNDSFVLTRAPAGTVLAQHESHASHDSHDSHDSHASHDSHSSHSSHASHYSGAMSA